MATEVLRRRGTTAEHASFTGAAGELTIDLTKNTVVVHDGSTAGGHPLLKESALAGDVTLTGDLLPDMTGGSGGVSIHSLGSATAQWQDVYIGPGSLYINGTKVLEESGSDIIVSADANQNLSMQTSGTGNLSFQAAGSGDIEMDAAMNTIQLKSTVQIAAGKNVTSSDGNPISFSDGIDMNGNAITGLPAPSSASDAVTKTYMETHVSTEISTGTANSANWDTAFGWGDHSAAGYAASSHTHTKSQITDFSDGDYATAAQGTKADTAFGWGDHGAENYSAKDTTNTFTTNQIIDTSSTDAALRVTQTGTGLALLVEDSANPDASPFYVDSDGNVVVAGNLTVNGTQTIVNSNEVNINDAVILLNADETGAPSQNAGIEVERGTATNVSFVWDEANDRWTTGGTAGLNNLYTGNVNAQSLSIRSNDVATVSDISMQANANIAADESLYFYIDADDTSTSSVFSWRKDSGNTTGGTELMQLTEAGVLTVTGATDLNSTVNVRLASDNGGNSHIGFDVNNDVYLTSGSSTGTNGQIVFRQWDGTYIERAKITDGGVLEAKVIESNGGITYDPSSTGGGADTATNVAYSMASGTRIVGHDGGYIRTLLKWTNGADIEIGQNGTTMIGGIDLKPGASGQATVNGYEILTADASGNLYVGDGRQLTIVDQTSVPDSPTSHTDAEKVIAIGAHGGIYQVSGRGGLMLTSSDDALILANGDVGRSYGSNISGSGEEMYLLSDSSVAIKTGLQNGWGNDEKTFTFGSDGKLTVPDGIGIGTTPSATSKVHILDNTDTTANANHYAAFIDYNVSGSDATSGDRGHYGIYVDADSSATGGDTNHEHRLVGITSDTRATGDSDWVYAFRGYAESNHSSGTITDVRGGSFDAFADGAGTTTSTIGVWGYGAADGAVIGSGVYGAHVKADISANQTSTVPNAHGIRAEVEMDSTGTLTNAYGVTSVIDKNAGTITNGYLFYGDYQGTATNSWGVYITDNVPNYFNGEVRIGTTTDNGDYKLQVNGDAYIEDIMYSDRARIGRDGGGDSHLDFYDDNSNVWRSIWWDDSANTFKVEDNSSNNHVLLHAGNVGSYAGGSNLGDIIIGSPTTTSSFSGSAGQYWTPPAGFYLLWSQNATGQYTSTADIQFYLNGGWRDTERYGAFFTDGSNVRIKKGSTTVYYHAWT